MKVEINKYIPVPQERMSRQQQRAIERKQAKALKAENRQIAIVVAARERKVREAAAKAEKAKQGAA